MGFLDEILPDAVNDVMALLDTPATITRTPKASFNAATDTSVEGSPVDFEIFTAPPENYEEAEVNNTTILSTDFKIFVGTSGYPTGGVDLKTDVFKLGDVQYRIIKEESVMSGAEACGYYLQLRK